MSHSHTASQFNLNDLAFLRGLNADQLDRITEIASPRRWDAGVTIFREGDQDSVLYVVEEGHVAIEISVPGRGRVTILTVGTGEVFGWSSLFFERPKSASARTVEATKALALDANRLRALCDVDNHLGYVLTRRILEVVSLRLKATRMQLLDIYGH
jgi:CRP/FNR family transcriptional regulator, cyclic AMP receptor protein